VGHQFNWVDVDPSTERRTQFQISLPPNHRFVTVVIDDAEGVRVRNLLSMVDITTLGGDPAAKEPHPITINWNGLDDGGRPLPSGTYRVRGLSLPGLKIEFDYAFGSPGNPPWEGYPNSSWGGDHVFPSPPRIA